RIIHEVIRGGGLNSPDIAFMLDQCHNVENKIEGQIRSVLNVQEMTARALLLDTEALTAAQRAGDVIAAHDIFMDAFSTEVRRDSGYQERIAADRIGGTQAGWGA